MPEFDQDVQLCIDTLKKGGVILYPTDTIWGLGCDATHAEAVERIFQIKKRPETKAMIVLMADEKQVKKHVSGVDLRVFDYLHSVKKPTTVVYEGALGVAENLIADDGSIAVRLVKDSFCIHLIRRFRKPIVSTSANVSGMTPPRNFSEISDEIKSSVDYIVKHRQRDPAFGEPSAIIRYSEGSVVMLRP